jgi:hypothetical protein
MSFTCPKCGRVSHNPNDEREQYCGHCHEFVGELEIFVIYERPRDYPEHFVMRRWAVSSDKKIQATDYFRLADSLDEARSYVPAHCIRVERDPKDEPQVVESWI